MRPLETKGRSLVKALSYRINGTLGTVIVIYFLTGTATLSLTAGAIDLVLKTVIFYLHERVWDHVAWGRRPKVRGVVLFTGLSGAGKSTLASRLHEDLRSQGFTTELIDGDAVREVFKNVGFSRAERLRHLFSMSYISSLIEKQGSIVLAAFIAPYEEGRSFFRDACENYVEVWIDTPLAECERRDVKGLYAKARSGEITSFTGVSDAFEAPSRPDLVISTENSALEQSYLQLVQGLKEKLPGLKGFHPRLGP